MRATWGSLNLFYASKRRVDVNRPRRSRASASLPVPWIAPSELASQVPLPWHVARKTLSWDLPLRKWSGTWLYRKWLMVAKVRTWHHPLSTARACHAPPPYIPLKLLSASPQVMGDFSAFAVGFAVRQAIKTGTGGKPTDDDVGNIFDTLTDDDSDRLTAILVGLGPCFVKLGQTLSCRPDLLGEKLAGRLAKLQVRGALAGGED